MKRRKYLGTENPISEAGNECFEQADERVYREEFLDQAHV
jgi:hypothetical protein